MPPLSAIAGCPGCPGRFWLRGSPSWDGDGRRAGTHDWLIGHASGRSEPVPGTGWCSRPAAGHPCPPALRVTHDVLACWLGVSRSTITWAVGEVRPQLAERGCTVEGGLRLRTLADVVAHLGARGSSA